MSQAIFVSFVITIILNGSLYTTKPKVICFESETQSVGAITDDQNVSIQKELINIGTTCIIQHPITIQDVKSFKNKEFPDGANAGCFMSCVFKKAGIFDENGALSEKTAIEKATNIFDNESELKNLESFITACSKVNDENVADGDEGCDRAKLAFNCLIENSEQFGFNLEF